MDSTDGSEIKVCNEAQPIYPKSVTKIEIGIVRKKAKSFR